MAQRGLLAAAGITVATLGVGAKALAGRRRPDPHHLMPQFRTFLANYVPAGPASTIWSMFARFTAAGRIDLSRTKTLSDLLHELQRMLGKQQAANNKRYYNLMNVFRKGVKAFEEQQAAGTRRSIRLADELKLSERSRDLRRQALGL